ncbi:MAG TPA: PQQ-binding-like beta-propeller repeat protein, partial [Vicinamibacterales bacterium]|nr:PQQ-binding-like beta-propeller repeat protein [Vicinamibacterales bacterium]
MCRYIAIPASALLVYTLSLSAASAPRPGVDWPQFRGIAANGVAEGFALPAVWNVAEGKNILWKADVPGLGHSSPVVWGNDVFISTSISGSKDGGLRIGAYGDIKPVQDDTEHEWLVYALDKKTGKVKWRQTAFKGVPKIKRHTKATHA